MNEYIIRYSIAIVGVCAPELTELLGKSSTGVSFASSCALLGAFIGSPLSGAVCERFGRRVGTIIGELCIITGAIVCAFAPSWWVVFVGRTVLGVGIGFCTLAKPLYVKETVSSARVSTILAGFAPSVALGVMIARSMAWVTCLHWAGKALVGAAPAAILLLTACTVMPESPAWRQHSTAQSSCGGADSSVAQTTREPANHLKGCASPALRLALVLACALGVSNQGTGSYLFNVYGAVLLPLEPLEDSICAVANVVGALMVPFLVQLRSEHGTSPAPSLLSPLLPSCVLL